MNNKIKDNYFHKGPKNPLNIAIGLVAVMGVSAYLVNGHEEDDFSGLLSSVEPNALFCRNPEFSDDFLGDPFVSLNNGASGAIYDQFWKAAADHQTIGFDFDYNMTTTGNRANFFREIPQNVINDSNITFILTGHATDDLKDVFERGVPVTDKFMEEYKNHLEDNKDVASARLDFIKAQLVNAGIDEDRIALRNLNTRYDKRAVDLEVCMPEPNEL